MTTDSNATPRTFVIYDSRAISDVDTAIVMSTCTEPDRTLADAIREAPDYGACVIYSYAGEAGDDERFEWADAALTREAAQP